jgi:2-polyprenyl-3-methyl-5-hydroxy-6-metoxy-1,4-benzoquinol methylase
MLRYVPPETRTSLEFGCGTGEFSALVKRTFGAETWAVEINADAARRAAKRLDKLINRDAAESLDEIPQGYFDCIILFDVLEHMVDPAFLLGALKAKLTARGVIVASIPNIRYYRTLADLVVHGNWDYKEHGILDRTHLRFFTKKSIIKMFSLLGFRIELLEGIHPTSSRTFRILNMILLNRLADVRYKHFAVVARAQ